MKEDVLEQIVDDYLQFDGYFTMHNVRFRPSPDDPDYGRAQDAVPSDVDVVGLPPGEGWAQPGCRRELQVVAGRLQCNVEAGPVARREEKRKARGVADIP